MEVWVVKQRDTKPLVQNKRSKRDTKPLHARRDYK